MRVRTRSEAARFIAAQMDRHYKPQPIPPKDPAPRDGKGGAWHYGRCELRALMDFIYGGPPQTREEEIDG